LPGVDPGVDPIQNHMNLLPGACTQSKGEFTPLQVGRMLDLYEAFRLDSVCRPDRVTCVNTTQCCGSMICAWQRTDYRRRLPLKCRYVE
jgi:hypothetical protein